MNSAPCAPISVVVAPAVASTCVPIEGYDLASAGDPSTGWQIVPATVRDAEGYTIEEFEQVAADLADQGDKITSDLAAKRAWDMRRWLTTALVQGRDN